MENPNTGKTLATVSAAEAEDVDRAVASAKNAYVSWKTSDPSVRRTLLNKLADLVESDALELASLEALEAGILYRDSMGLHFPESVSNLRYFAGWADKLNGDTLGIPQGLAYTRREPIGVTAAVFP